MSQEICVIGTGYVGLVAAVGLADFGNRVTGVDIDSEKVKMLNKGKSPIYEAGIEEYLKRNLESGRLAFSTDLARSVSGALVVYLAVGTPPLESGEADLTDIFKAVDAVTENLDSYKVIITKSTVPVGTNRTIIRRIEEKTKKKGGEDFDIVSNPEFLREGRAVHDFFHPDRIVIGCESEKAKEIMEEVYRALYLISVPFVWCGLETAELIKYASNAFLAVKITFINQIASLAEAVGADVHQVAKSMGMDGRISPKFLHPGPGYGGSCFPKDTRALAYMGETCGTCLGLIKAAIKANEAQKERMVYKLVRLFSPEFPAAYTDNDLADVFGGTTIALLGLAFKQETDDIRESPALHIVKRLTGAGASVKAHDPKAIEVFKKVFPNLTYCSSSYEALQGADALVLATEWNEYRSLDLELAASMMTGKRILDARNLLDPEYARSTGFAYDGVGRGEYSR
jgi:UDPglucose 6-dehydrogenase